MLFAAEPSDGAVADASSPPPLSRASTPAKRSCEARKASSRVAALPPTPALSFLRNCFTSDVLPCPALPRPWPSHESFCSSSERRNVVECGLPERPLFCAGSDCSRHSRLRPPTCQGFFSFPLPERAEKSASSTSAMEQ